MQWNKLEGMKEFALFVSNDYNNYHNITSDSKITSSQVGLNSALYLRGEKGFIQNQTNLALNEVNYDEWKGLYHWMHLSSYFSGVRKAKWGEYLFWFKPEYRTDQHFISSMEAALQIPSNKNWKWKWSGSRIARFPTANELYWQPGGNPYLKPEMGSWIKSSLVVSKSKWQWDAESKCGWIKNWIQWSPINNQVWSPMNIKSVRLWQTTVGLTFHSKLKTGRIVFNTSLQYSSSLGKNESTSNTFQMIYTPKWKSHAHVDIHFGSWNALISSNYISSRFTDEANSMYTQLPSIFLADISVSRLVKLDSNHLELHVGVSLENLTNVNYQWIRGYITPGSVYTINLKLNFK
jgi:outer membrane cobalamin receptor